jgi:hypothetical protein
VDKKLDNHYGRMGNFTHDKMHVSSLVDGSMRNPSASHNKQFEWLNKMTVDITKAMKFVNWGKEEAHFVEVGYK